MASCLDIGQRHAPYLRLPIRNVKEVVKIAKKELSKVEYDALVGTGLSGTMIVPILAYVLNKRFAIVRKEDDQSHHSSGMVESGLNDGDRWIFVDDFQSSGATRERVIDKMAEHHNYKMNFIGRYMYSDEHLFKATDEEKRKPDRDFRHD